ncbi:MAG: T9SS type A sorting domain-containing protein [Bacteroidales bacterium]|nr:T9SS type A sorting domain-containing protein [Bacteroidales bacterium]
MFKIFFVFQVFLSLSVLSQNCNLHSGCEFCSKSKQKLHQDIQNAKNIKAAGKEIDIYYHRMHWVVNPHVRYIQGEVTSYFIALENTSNITFDLSDTLVVDSVIYNTENLSFSLESDLLTIILPSALVSGATDSVSIFYHGVPRVGPRAFTQSYYYDHPQLWTLSEPYGSLEWWPCNHDLNDKIDSIDVYVTAPEQYLVAGNGLIENEWITDTLKTIFWKHRHPIAAYLVAFAVSDYVAFEDYISTGTNDSLYFLNYLFPEDSTEIKPLLNLTHDMLNLYSEYFIDYPFDDEKYGHAQFDWTGAMEHQTMTFMGAGAASFGYETNSHELAHQWFGNYITCGSWSDIWLNESFATYMTGWGYQFMFNGIYWKKWLGINIERITAEPDGSVYVIDTLDVARVFSSRLSYRKGAHVLHMLRWELGDSAWYTAIRNYLNDALLANGYARTQDLINHFETAADTNLTEFFNDWFYGEGYPIYQLHYIQTADNELTLTIDQTQSHSSVSFFEMHLPLKFFGEGKDTLIRVKHDFSGQVFYINPGFMIDSIQLDPDMWIITKDVIIENISQIHSSENLTVFPNPTEDFLYVKTKQPITIKKIEAFDSTGKLVGSENFNTSGQFVKIPVRSFAKGQYLLKIETNGHPFTYKFIKY